MLASIKPQTLAKCFDIPEVFLGGTMKDMYIFL